MKAFVFWTGIYNIVVGFSVFFPKLFAMLGVRLPDHVAWTEMIAVLIMILGVMLVVCSRDLATRAPVVVWEGIGRLAAFLHLGWFGFMEGFGVMLGLIGVVDLIIGLVYIFGLPKHLGRSLSQLVLDRS